MKLICKQVVLAAVFLLPLSASVYANDVGCPGGAAPVMGDNGPECPAPAAELPEPSSPLLFLAAAGVAVVARKLRNRK